MSPASISAENMAVDKDILSACDMELTEIPETAVMPRIELTIKFFIVDYRVFVDFLISYFHLIK